MQVSSQRLEPLCPEQAKPDAGVEEAKEDPAQAPTGPQPLTILSLLCRSETMVECRVQKPSLIKLRSAPYYTQKHCATKQLR